jgi:ParB family chromosome partitioning protein
MARKVLGEIDLDPASSSVANATVKAKQWFDDGLTKPWRGRVWMNPPYAQPLIGQFITKLVEERSAHNVTAAIALTHNYTDTAWFHEAEEIAEAICFTRGRISFVDPEGNEASPTQGQAFFYYGDNKDLFADVFKDVGFIR